MRVSWLSDVHFDHLYTDNEILQFAKTVNDQNSDCVLITGDISVAPYFVKHMSLFESVCQKQVNYILGNHDFYGASIQSMRLIATNLNNTSSYLRYLGAIPYVRLSERTTLIGHDGWYDCHWALADIQMSDWTYIKDLSEVSRTSVSNLSAISDRCKLIVKDSVQHIRNGIMKSINDGYRKIIIATHVPPFVEILDEIKKTPKTGLSRRHRFDELRSWYISNNMGKMIKAAARANDDVKFDVYCGHLHESCTMSIYNNLTVNVGCSKYSEPEIQGIIEVE